LRLDKFLKSTRIIKRRTIAQELAKNKRIFRNQIALKPSSEIKSGDILEIFLKNRYLKVKVISDVEYEILEEKKIEEGQL
jgi:ribosomal 50S subunit-recycling heat shock protein